MRISLFSVTSSLADEAEGGAGEKTALREIFLLSFLRSLRLPPPPNLRRDKFSRLLLSSVCAFSSTDVSALASEAASLAL